MPDDGPSERAYGHVTDSGQYLVLHEVAADLLDKLVTKYQVAHEVTQDEALGGHGERVERLVPAGGGAPLTVAFTGFPGLRVRFGKWFVESFPNCGCDACDEQPEDVAHDFVGQVEALVAGAFTEQLRRLPRPMLTYSFRPGDEGHMRLRYADARRLGRAGRRRWEAWRPR